MQCPNRAARSPRGWISTTIASKPRQTPSYIVSYCVLQPILQLLYVEQFVLYSLAPISYASSSQLSGTSSPLGRGAGTGGGGWVAAAESGRDRGAEADAELEAPLVLLSSHAAGFVEVLACPDVGRVTTDVQPRGVCGGVGPDGVNRLEPAAGRATGARRSASLPSDDMGACGETDAERTGEGTRVSRRLKSCTLRCGSWSTSRVSRR